MLLNVSPETYPLDYSSKTSVFQHSDSFITESKTELINPQNYF